MLKALDTAISRVCQMIKYRIFFLQEISYALQEIDQESAKEKASFVNKKKQKTLLICACWFHRHGPHFVKIFAPLFLKSGRPTLGSCVKLLIIA
jgi:hypothetical protein